MPNEKPYEYARFSWEKHDVEELANKLKERFTLVKPPVGKKEKKEDSHDLITDHFNLPSEEIEVKADTLFVLLSALRANLFQKEKAPFTEKDMELRETVLALYPHTSRTPIPIEFGVKEPKFEKQSS